MNHHKIETLKRIAEKLDIKKTFAALCNVYVSLYIANTVYILYKSYKGETDYEYPGDLLYEENMCVAM